MSKPFFTNSDFLDFSNSLFCDKINYHHGEDRMLPIDYTSYENEWQRFTMYCLTKLSIGFNYNWAATQYKIYILFMAKQNKNSSVILFDMLTNSAQLCRMYPYLVTRFRKTCFEIPRLPMLEMYYTFASAVQHNLHIHRVHVCAPFI